MTKLGIYKEDGNLPQYATEGSACFDLCAHIPDLEYIEILPGETILIPTGIFMDIPEDYVVKLYSRSGLSSKRGLALINCVGIIDSDYVEEVKVPLHNHSKEMQIVNNGERICQAEFTKVLKCDIVKLNSKPLQKTSRMGGFGSTGN